MISVIVSSVVCFHLLRSMFLYSVCVCLCVKARAYNCQIRPAVLDSSSRVKWTSTTHHPPHLVGEEVSARV